MPTVAVNPPKTPVTEGSHGIAAATVPNICKMPGPPAPFIPTPLPNIGDSTKSPKNYSKKVKVEGKKVAIKGATFKSMGDIASKGTGGGIVSSNTEGPTSFAGPGSMNVKFEGKNVQLLGDPMLNNCGPSGNPPNSATLVGVVQGPSLVVLAGDEPCPLCGKTHGDKGKLEETEDTKSDASTFGDLVRAMPLNQSAMLGVLRCKCGKVYAGKSSKKFAQIPPGVPKSWHMRDPELRRKEDLRDQFASHIGEKKRHNFRQKWDIMRLKALEWNGRGHVGEPYYNPGECAAQLLILLALEHNDRPIGLTERYYDPVNPEATTPARFRKMKEKRAKSGQKKKRQMGIGGHVYHGQFGGEQAVPPCGTCQVILTMLICPNETPEKCAHSVASKGTCTCNP